jgi:hypothetical protein
VVVAAGEEECGMSPDAMALVREGSGNAWRVRSLTEIRELCGGTLLALSDETIYILFSDGRSHSSWLVAARA